MPRAHLSEFLPVYIQNSQKPTLWSFYKVRLARTGFREFPANSLERIFTCVGLMGAACGAGPRCVRVCECVCGNAPVGGCGAAVVCVAEVYVGVVWWESGEASVCVSCEGGREGGRLG